MLRRCRFYLIISPSFAWRIFTSANLFRHFLCWYRAGNEGHLTISFAIELSSVVI